MEIWFKEGRTNKFLGEFQYLGRSKIPEMSSFCMWKHIANNHLPLSVQSHHKNEKMLFAGSGFKWEARSLKREVNGEVGVSVAGKQRPYGLTFSSDPWPLLGPSIQPSSNRDLGVRNIFLQICVISRGKKKVWNCSMVPNKKPQHQISYETLNRTISDSSDE